MCGCLRSRDSAHVASGRVSWQVAGAGAIVNELRRLASPFREPRVGSELPFDFPLLTRLNRGHGDHPNLRRPAGVGAVEVEGVAGGGAAAPGAGGGAEGQRSDANGEPAGGRDDGRSGRAPICRDEPIARW